MLILNNCSSEQTKAYWYSSHCTGSIWCTRLDWNFQSFFFSADTKAALASIRYREYYRHSSLASDGDQKKNLEVQGWEDLSERVLPRDLLYLEIRPVFPFCNIWRAALFTYRLCNGRSSCFVVGSRCLQHCNFDSSPGELSTTYWQLWCLT